MGIIATLSVFLLLSTLDSQLFSAWRCSRHGFARPAAHQCKCYTYNNNLLSDCRVHMLSCKSQSLQVQQVYATQQGTQTWLCRLQIPELTRGRMACD